LPWIWSSTYLYFCKREKKNVDLLYKYITHLLLNTDFKESAQIVEKDRVFVPIGWDLQPKINIIREQNKKVANEDEDYGSVVFVPNTIKKKERTKVLHTSAAEDDQEFLVKLQAREGNPVKQKPVTTAVPPGAVVTAEQPKRREERSNSTTETPPPVSADEITTPRDQPEPQKQSTTTPSRPHEKDRSKLRQKESSSVKLVQKNLWHQLELMVHHQLLLQQHLAIQKMYYPAFLPVYWIDKRHNRKRSYDKKLQMNWAGCVQRVQMVKEDEILVLQVVALVLLKKSPLLKIMALCKL